MCMARLNVYVPDALADAARKAGLNVSALTREAITAAVARSATDSWLETLRDHSRPIDHDVAIRALDEAREELDG